MSGPIRSFLASLMILRLWLLFILFLLGSMGFALVFQQLLSVSLTEEFGLAFAR